MFYRRVDKSKGNADSNDISTFSDCNFINIYKSICRVFDTSSIFDDKGKQLDEMVKSFKEPEYVLQNASLFRLNKKCDILESLLHLHSFHFSSTMKEKEEKMMENIRKCTDCQQEQH